jgi:hypothetical protein
MPLARGCPTRASAVWLMAPSSAPDAQAGIVRPPAKGSAPAGTQVTPHDKTLEAVEAASAQPLREEPPSEVGRA